MMVLFCYKYFLLFEKQMLHYSLSLFIFKIFYMFMSLL